MSSTTQPGSTRQLLAHGCRQMACLKKTRSGRGTCGSRPGNGSCGGRRGSPSRHRVRSRPVQPHSSQGPISIVRLDSNRMTSSATNRTRPLRPVPRASLRTPARRATRSTVERLQHHLWASCVALKYLGSPSVLAAWTEPSLWVARSNKLGSRAMLSFPLASGCCVVGSGWDNSDS
jgi:hypothetical protein